MTTTPAAPPTPHHYFVSYATPHGYGNAQIDLHLPVRDMKDVRLLADLIAEQAGTDRVTVLNFIALP